MTTSHRVSYFQILEEETQAAVYIWLMRHTWAEYWATLTVAQYCQPQCQFCSDGCTGEPNENGSLVQGPEALHVLSSPELYISLPKHHKAKWILQQMLNWKAVWYPKSGGRQCSSLHMLLHCNCHHVCLLAVLDMCWKPNAFGVHHFSYLCLFKGSLGAEMGRKSVKFPRKG